MTKKLSGQSMRSEKLQRICFVLRAKQDRLEEYKERHRAVWPELPEGFRETGWHNFSLFLREDGPLVGHVKAPDFARALAEMAAKEVTEPWQAEMRDFFEDIE